MDNSTNMNAAENTAEAVFPKVMFMFDPNYEPKYEDAHRPMLNYYKNSDPISIQGKIRRFRALNFKTISDEDLFTEISNVLCIDNFFAYPVNVRILGKGTEFFRVRKLRGTIIPFDNFSIISDMWEPPNEKVTRPERLNKIGESLLYTTLADPFIAIQEARVQGGDIYALIKYIAKDDVKVNVIGGGFEQDELPFNDANSIIVFNLINDFLRDEFSRIVGEGTEYLYRISESIAKDYFDLPPRVSQDAWAYSSIQDKHKYNVCFRPDIAHELLSLHGAIVCKKDESDGIKAICVAVPSMTDNTIKFHRLGSEIQRELFPEIEC